MGAPVAHPDKDRSADDVPQHGRQQIPPKRLNRLRAFVSIPGMAGSAAGVNEQNFCGNEIHVGDAGREPEGYKAQDWKENCEYFADGLAGRQCPPDYKADEQVAADSSPKRLAVM